MALLLLAGLTGRSRVVRADEPPSVPLGTVEVEAQSESASDAPAPDAPPFVTVIDARAPSARVVSVADLVERAAGVHVRSRGGLGAFTSVSIRGSDPSEVAVYLDGVPLNRATGAAVDLAQLPVEDLERVEIYRGVPPVELGGDAIGGAIHLVSRRGLGVPRLRVSVGAGSFGARSASVSYSGTSGGLRVAASASYHGATGDFLYYDYQGTLRDPSDDMVSRRRNNGFDQVALDVSVGRPQSGAAPSWSLATHGFLKQQGVPGLGSAGAETTHASLTTGRILVDGTLARTTSELDGRVSAHLLYQRIAFDNTGGERVGNFGPSQVEGETVAAGLDARADAPLGTHQLVTVLGELRLEHFQPYDLLSPTASQAASLRLRGALALVDEVRLWSDRVALEPAVRVDGVGNHLAPGQGTMGPQATGSTSADAYVSPRLGLRVRVTDWLALKGNVGRFVRLPTLIELFGDGAFILPRPSLRAESAWGGDLGAQLALRRGALDATLEGDLFGRTLDDTIVLQPSARGLAAINIGSSRALGAEVRAQARLGTHLGVTVEYTLLDTANLSAAPRSDGSPPQLPLRARHELSGRIDLAAGPFALFYEASYLSTVYRDTHNDDPLPARWLHAIGVTVGPFTRWSLVLDIDVRNLTDLRVVPLQLGGSANQGVTVPYPLVDVFDYPLPGRAIYATLGLRT